jgi:hypothetical protein
MGTKFCWYSLNDLIPSARPIYGIFLGSYLQCFSDAPKPILVALLSGMARRAK